MRVGGFVIHGNNRDTLGPCLDSLLASCDEVVAVDSLSNDGSAQLVRERGARSISLPWQGYGAARASAAKALAHCDYLFFLDSDERLSPGFAEPFAQWRASAPKGPLYTVRLDDWVHLGSHSFRFRRQLRTRFFRTDAATWTPQMIVHERVANLPRQHTRIVVEHRFAEGLSVRTEKDERYALLWAVQAAAQGKRPKPAGLQRAAWLVRDLLLKGALFRGGLDAVRLTWATSAYHQRKHQLLSLLRAGRYPELLEHYRAERYLELFEAVPRVAAKSRAEA
jgi:glycosyltransferase involved in cell wall biosynthesis